jgi:4-hydroxybutyryl-CoA dehydratase / vinylacetyl-CoA-Delta-isomerase
MGLMNGAQYRDSIRRLRRPVYFQGKLIENVVDHPLTRPHVDSAAMTYELAHNSESEGLLTATSHLSGEKVNRFTHIHQSTDDLLRKVKMLRHIAQQTGTCFQRCVGLDALNALYGITHDMDAKLGSGYHARLRAFLSAVQKNDLMCAGSMTDPKGDRSLAPGKQADPDLYLRIVERRDDGIVVRGAKAHQTGSLNAHEIIAMPTAALGPEDVDYAVSFAIPSDAPGLIYIFGRQTNDTRRLEGCIDQGNARYGVVGGECLLVFENVFVPWERVFMCGEVQFAGQLVERFASYHRQNYGGCKTGVADVLIGATVALAEYQGVAGASHVRDKVVEMVHLAETLYCGSIACSAEGKPTACGQYFVDPLLANTTKLNVTRFVYEIARLAHDIAGGFIATMPSETDLHDPFVGPYVEKYFKGAASVPTEHRIRIGRLLENMSGGTALIESLHGAGSPQAQRIMVLRQAQLDQKKKMALRLAGIEE